jgi:hypothetical protein
VVRRTIKLLLLTVTLPVACLLAGCHPLRAASPSGSSAAPDTRNNCYSLLHQLLDEQKDVSMLRFIKREHSDVRNLINKIAVQSGTASKLLEDFARRDPSINLNDIGLPSGEIATRAAIASAKKNELLGQSGEALDLTLLLTQTEALSYAWRLAKVTSENEPQADRAHALASVSEDMKNLYQEVFALLLSKTRSSGI